MHVSTTVPGRIMTILNGLGLHRQSIPGRNRTGFMGIQLGQEVLDHRQLCIIGFISLLDSCFVLGLLRTTRIFRDISRISSFQGSCFFL